MVIDEQQPWNQHSFIGGFYIRQMALAFGQVHEGHAHYIDHVSNVTKPPLRVETWDPETDKRDTIDVLVPCKLHIKAKLWHKFSALSQEGCAWECWFSQKEAEGLVDVPINDFQYEVPRDPNA